MPALKIKTPDGVEEIALITAGTGDGLRIRCGGTTYDISLVATDHVLASPIRFMHHSLDVVALSRVGISCVELQETMTVTNDDEWQERDLHTLFGVPKGAVVQIILINLSEASDNIPGARMKGSVLDETWQLTKANDGGCMMSIFVQTDVDGKIEIYNSYSTNVAFRLIEYLTGCTFTRVPREDMLSGDGAWEDEDVFTNFSIPKSRVLSVAIQNIEDDTSWWGGVRANGSAITRLIKVIHRTGDVGMGTAGCMLVQVDSNGIVEVYREDGSIQLYLQGYFSSNVQFTEAFSDAGGTTSGAWTDRDLDAVGAPNDAIATMHLLNARLDGGLYAGVRKDGSALDRREDIRESETMAQTGYMALVVTGSSNATIEIYEQSYTLTAVIYSGYLSDV